MDRVNFKNNLKVSVIIPTYNRPLTLKKVVKSYILSCNELIIVNDGSTKDYSSTIRFIKKECKKHGKIFKYIQNKKRKGSAYSRTLGIKKSSFNLIFFSDDDIILSPEYIPECIKVLNEQKASIVGGRIVYRGSKNKNFEKRLIDPSTLEGNFSVNRNEEFIQVPFLHIATLWNVEQTFKKGIKFFHHYFVNGYREETDPMIQVSKKGGKILFIPRITCYHLSENEIEKGGQKKSLKIIYYIFIHINNLIFLIRHHYYLSKLTRKPLFLIWMKGVLKTDFKQALIISINEFSILRKIIKRLKNFI